MIANGLPPGCIYNGPHECPNGTALWFTDTETGSSFLVMAKEATPERIAAELVCVRARFATAAKNFEGVGTVLQWADKFRRPSKTSGLLILAKEPNHQ